MDAEFAELAGVAELLEGARPTEMLEWAVGQYGKRLTLSVSFGNAEGMVLLDMLSRITDEVRIFTLDTGFLFRETRRFREEVMRRSQGRLEVFHQQLTVAEQAEWYGEELYRRQPDMCCQVRKVEPQERALHGYRAWLTGLRRDQTPQRVGTSAVGWDERFRVVKIAPLASWSSEDVEEYVREHKVPLNPLIGQGYKSIGCEPCTRPVKPGEDERAGRWPNLEKTECGIHLSEGTVHSAHP